MDFSEDIIPFAGILLIVFWGGFFIGAYGGENKIKKQAISNNVAYYSVNKTNGITTFEWIKK